MGSQDANVAEPGRGSQPLGKLAPGPGMAAKDVAAHQSARIQAATIAIVAERGYAALKVRDVVGRAGVSTRAFYELFGSKEACFLRTYEAIARRASSRIIAAQVGEPDWRRRARLALEEFFGGLQAGPDAARLSLLEAYGADERALASAWHAERTLEGMLAESLARPPGGVALPSLILEGMLAGIAGVSKRRLLAGEVEALGDLSDPLVDWACCHVDGAAELSELDQGTVWRDTTLEPLSPSSFGAEVESRPATGDRALILKAVANLVAEHGYAKLTAARVRSAASVSRRKFDAYFDSLEDCYLAALELRASEALAQAARAQAAARSWAGGVYRAIAALTDHLAEDAFLARVLLTREFPPGPEGVRFRRHLSEAVAELLGDNAPESARTHPIVVEASQGAVWSLTQRHLIRDRRLQRKISASLGYLALVPYLSGAEVVAAIREEQGLSTLHQRDRQF